MKGLASSRGNLILRVNISNSVGKSPVRGSAGGSACIRSDPFVTTHALRICRPGWSCIAIVSATEPAPPSRFSSPASCSRSRPLPQRWRFITSWRQRTTTGMSTPIPTSVSGCNITPAIRWWVTHRSPARSWRTLRHLLSIDQSSVLSPSRPPELRARRL